MAKDEVAGLWTQIICTLSYASRTTNGLHTMFLQDLQVKKVKVINGI